VSAAAVGREGGEKAYDTNVNGKNGRQVNYLHRSMHRSLQCPRPRPPRHAHAHAHRHAHVHRHAPTPVTPNSDSMFSRCHPRRLRAVSSYELASSMSSKRSSSTCSYKGDTGEFRLGVLHDFKLIARKLLDFAPTRSTPAAA
jgi:hypothetical protein